MLLYIVYFTLLPTVLGSLQSAGAKGKLLCNGKPASGVRVELYDVDRLFGDSDELLGQITSSINGTFEVSGSTREFTSIDPKLIVYPNCKGENKPMEFIVPDEFISEGDHADKIYDIGTIEMLQTVIASASSDSNSSESGSGVGKIATKVVDVLKKNSTRKMITKVIDVVKGKLSNHTTSVPSHTTNENYVTSKPIYTTSKPNHTTSKPNRATMVVLAGKSSSADQFGLQHQCF
uniref:Uncharacterized protein n=1 Tax=Acrobeloides nanus TaxID=290746 RepID=A0A914CAC2_9BILA